MQGFQQLPSQAVGITGLQGVIDYPTIHPIPAPASVPTSGITAPVLEFVPSNVQQVIFPGTPVANNLLNGPYSWIVNPQSGIPLTNPPVYEKNNHDGGNNP